MRLPTLGEDAREAGTIVLVAFAMLLVVVVTMLIIGAGFRGTGARQADGGRVCDPRVRFSSRKFAITTKDDAVSLGRALCRRLLCADGVSCCGKVAGFSNSTAAIDGGAPQLTRDDCYNLIEPVYCKGFAMGAGAYESDARLSTWLSDFASRAPQMRSACKPFCVSSVLDIKECARRRGRSVKDLLAEDPTLAQEVSTLSDTQLSPTVFNNGDRVRLLHDAGADKSVVWGVELMRTGERAMLTSRRDVSVADFPPTGLSCTLRNLTGAQNETIDLSTSCDPPLVGAFANVNKASFDALGRPLFSVPFPRKLSTALASGMSQFWAECSADCSP